MNSVPWGTWQHRSPLLTSGALGASGHVATPKLFPGGWRALCHGAYDDTGALFWWVACSVPCDMWRSQSLLTPGTDLEPWGWSFKSCAQWFPIYRLPTYTITHTWYIVQVQRQKVLIYQALSLSIGNTVKAKPSTSRNQNSRSRQEE
jgi:hypothetical protein